MKILQMATYDVDYPDHGGKLRSHHIRKSLREGYDVETLSFVWSDIEDCSSLKVSLDLAKWTDLGIDGMLSDWGICTYLERYPKAFDTLSEHVRFFSPDVLLVEQPFLWPLAERFITDGVVSSSVKVIYSSHNIEVAMKRKIYSELYPKDQAQRYTELVDCIEQGVIKACVGALAVSERDAAYVHQLCPGKPTRVFLNGHSCPRATAEDDKWIARFMSHSVNWVFVGSWHQPNINGLRSLIEAVPEAVPPDSFALWVLGSAGSGLLASAGFDASRYPWLQIMGPVEADEIDSAIMQSSGVVLPIWEGGGSNLKTAQALLSGKCVLGSTFSFRGFEHCIHEQGVLLAEDAAGLARLLLETRPAASYPRGSEVHGLEWSAVLATLPDYLAEIIETEGRVLP